MLYWDMSCVLLIFIIEFWVRYILGVHLVDELNEAPAYTSNQFLCLELGLWYIYIYIYACTQTEMCLNLDP